MREVELRITEDQHREVISILEERDIEFISQEADESLVVRFPLPTAAVSVILDELREVGIGEESYTVVKRAEVVRTETFSKRREEYLPTVRKLAVAELHTKIRELQWPYQLYYAGTLLSVLAAASGLLLDQPALIIGAMVIAPQVSSALAAPAGVMWSDWELFVDSIKEQGLGLGVAIIGAALFGLGLRQTALVPQHLSVAQIELVGVRLAPSFLSTVGAFAAGAVGAFGYTTEQTSSLVGVMITAAIIPAAAAAGLGIAWAAPLLAVGATLLLLVNILAINIGAFFTLIMMGYRPEWVTADHSFRDSIPSERRLAVYTTIFALLVATLGTGVITAGNISFTHDINQEVDRTLSETPYRSLSLVKVQSELRGPDVAGEPSNVTIRVSRTSNRSYPNLASTLERRIQRRTGRDVMVTVEFTESRTANSAVVSQSSSREDRVTDTVESGLPVRVLSSD